jgi:hypothetical protein
LEALSICDHVGEELDSIVLREPELTEKLGSGDEARERGA